MCGILNCKLTHEIAFDAFRGKKKKKVSILSKKKIRNIKRKNPKLVIYCEISHSFKDTEINKLPNKKKR